MCVFMLSCFLAKFVRYSLKLVGYIKEKVQDVEVEMCLGIVFICSMEYLVCFCAASLVEKERCNKMKWSYEKVDKDMLAIGGNELWSHREFCVSGGFWGEVYVVSIKVAQRWIES